MTQYWFGLPQPMPNKPTLEGINNHCSIAFSAEIGLGIRAAILRNGLVRFDFEKCEKGGVFVYREKQVSADTWQAIHDKGLEAREREVQDG